MLKETGSNSERSIYRTAVNMLYWTNTQQALSEQNGISYTQSKFDTKPGDSITEINMTLANDPLHDTIRLNTKKSVRHPYQKAKGIGGDYYKYDMSEYSRNGISYAKPKTTQISVKPGETVWLKIKLLPL